MPPRERGRRQPHGPSGRDADELLPWAVIYYLAPDETVPALEFLDGCPGTIDAQFTAVLDAVAAAPPPRFSGGGKWEAMHGSMGGWYEIRLTGPRLKQFRLFCLLENGTGKELARRGLPRQAIAVITGMRKPWRTVFAERVTSVSGNFGTEHQGIPAPDRDLTSPSAGAQYPVPAGRIPVGQLLRQQVQRPRSTWKFRGQDSLSDSRQEVQALRTLALLTRIRVA